MITSTTKGDVMQPHKINQQVQRFLIVAWVGNLWSIGFLAVPVLFIFLPRITAGMIAGKLFEISAWLGITSALILLICYGMELGFRVFKHVTSYIIVLLLICIMVNHFGITPIIATLKQAVHTANDSTNSLIVSSPSFAFWHAASSIIYYIQCALGIVLVCQPKNGLP